MAVPILNNISETEIINLIRDLEEVRQATLIASTKSEERWMSYTRALTLQSAEYERRLEHLNGEARRIAEERSVITAQLRREMELGFTATQKEIAQNRETLLNFIAEQRGLNRGVSLGWAVIIAIITIAVAVAGLILKFSK